MASDLEGLTILLEAFAQSNNKQERLGLACLSQDLVPEFRDRFSGLAGSVGGGRDSAEAEFSVVLTMRLLWELVPATLFSLANPDFEYLADYVLRNRFGPGGYGQQTVSYLAKIFRRIRNQANRGREGITTLDLDKISHKELFDSQERCCALCGYQFVDDDLVYEDEEAVPVPEIEPLPQEVRLQRYYRKPVLDHILPQYIGGDGKENWQILCQSCNGGKGEAVSWVFRRGWLPSMRVSDYQELTPAARYVAIARFHATGGGGDGELRVFKRDQDKLLTFDNVYATR